MSDTRFGSANKTKIPQDCVHCGLTSRPISAPPDGQVYPEFIRLPKPGTRCPLTGLSRGKLNELVLPSELNGFKPPVRSISMRQRGHQKGVRLVVVNSLLEYLYSLEESTQADDARLTV